MIRAPSHHRDRTLTPHTVGRDCALRTQDAVLSCPLYVLYEPLSHEPVPEAARGGQAKGAAREARRSETQRTVRGKVALWGAKWRREMVEELNSTR